MSEYFFWWVRLNFSLFHTAWSWFITQFVRWTTCILRYDGKNGSRIFLVPATIVHDFCHGRWKSRFRQQPQDVFCFLRWDGQWNQRDHKFFRQPSNPLLRWPLLPFRFQTSIRQFEILEVHNHKICIFNISYFSACSPELTSGKDFKYPKRCLWNPSLQLRDFSKTKDFNGPLLSIVKTAKSASLSCL